ncbi:MAG TPA: hypothetical protein VJ110_03690 [Candidatus Nanoarchaeia archaeon]|nr:hypothetical protein [Candidatus Nanoarchaeia archaeon]
MVVLPPHTFATIDAFALVFLGVSFILTLRLKKLMGEGKDTGPVKLLTTVIAVNFILGATLLLAIYQKSIGGYINYVRLTDVMMLVIGIVLTYSVWKIYKDYKKLIKKYEPNA